jgi:hypothetical protein
MKKFLARDLLALNDCGCCEGIAFQTPIEVWNRPELSAIAYRVGNYAQFKQSLLAHLSAAELPALQALTTRDDDDVAIALLDSWAVVADVLTFYQERIAQESYLRTATERFSIREMARLIGYQLRPGVAASTYLAFTLETAPGSPAEVRLAAGTKVQSIPGSDEQPQMVETVEAITARSAWNALRPRLSQPQTASSIAQSITVQGTTTNIQSGDKLLVIQRSDRTVKTVVRVVVDQTQQTTRLVFSNNLSFTPPAFTNPTFAAATPPATSVALTQSPIKSLILDKGWQQSDLLALAETQGWSLENLTESVTQELQTPSPPAQVFVFRLSASIFGYNAAKQVVYEEIGDDSSPQRVPKLNSNGTLQFTEWTIAADEKRNQIFLDNAYKEIAKDSHIAIQTLSTVTSSPSSGSGGSFGAQGFTLFTSVLGEPFGILSGITGSPSPIVARASADLAIPSGETVATEKVYQVKDTFVRSRNAYGLSGKTTQVTLTQNWWDAQNSDFPNTIRTATVYAHSEELTLALLPITTPISGNVITLNGFYLGLQPGQTALLTGERQDLKGVIASEKVILKTIAIQNSYTQITLQKGLTHSYIRDTVTLNANVAHATHGETVEELLGSGDASQPHQAFVLRQPPLTYTSSDATPSGALSTLEIRVNNLLWREAPMLYGQKPNDRIYVTRQAEDGKTVVQFGDGKTGARLPTGANNLQAIYRKGIGFAGNVRANQLTSLMSRPLGLKEVTNPIAAAGGEDGETLADARQNAPLTVLTLDRIVSLKDYEDFARAFAGIAKALATWTWNGQTRGVFITVAGPRGATIQPELIETLIRQMLKSGDPYVPLRVKSYRKAFFQVAGRIKINPDFQTEAVLAAVKQALTDTFSFERRAFGQGVALSEVMATIQAIAGVVAVDIDQLRRKELNIDGTKAPLPAAAPQVGGTNVFAAELLTLDPASLDHIGELP